MAHRADDEDDIPALALARIEEELTRLLGPAGESCEEFERFARLPNCDRAELACRLLAAEEAWIADEAASRRSHEKRTGISPRELKDLRRTVGRLADKVEKVNLSTGAAPSDAEAFDLPDLIRRWAVAGAPSFDTFPAKAARFFDLVREANDGRPAHRRVARIFIRFMQPRADNTPEDVERIAEGLRQIERRFR